MILALADNVRTANIEYQEALESWQEQEYVEDETVINAHLEKLDTLFDALTAAERALLDHIKG